MMAEQKKNKSKKIKLKGKPQTQPEKPSEEEKPFDFGGLPDRDLKKGLGCG